MKHLLLISLLISTAVFGQDSIALKNLTEAYLFSHRKTYVKKEYIDIGKVRTYFKVQVVHLSDLLEEDSISAVYFVFGTSTDRITSIMDADELPVFIAVLTKSYFEIAESIPFVYTEYNYHSKARLKFSMYSKDNAKWDVILKVGSRNPVYVHFRLDEIPKLISLLKTAQKVLK